MEGQLTRAVRIEQRHDRWTVERLPARLERLTATTAELEVRTLTGERVRAWFDRRSGEGMRNAKGGDRRLALVRHADWRGWRLSHADYSRLYPEEQED